MGRVGESRKFLTFVKKSVFFLPPSAPVYNGHKTSIRLFKLWCSVQPVYGKRREMDVCASQFQFWGGEEEKREIDGFVYFLSERDGPLLSCCTTVKKFPPYLPTYLPLFSQENGYFKSHFICRTHFWRFGVFECGPPILHVRALLFFCVFLMTC